MLANNKGLSKKQQFQKRTFDIVFSFLGLVFIWWIIVGTSILARISTGESGFFKQKRVGMHGVIFHVFKIRTMRKCKHTTTTVTTASDPRITKVGAFFRKTKIDELPQLWNVLTGEMSFVGPRPDIPGYADKLTGDDLLFLSIRPGITGPASLKYRNEELLLDKCDDSDSFNREVVFPDKVKINLEYIRGYSIAKDFGFIYKTVLSCWG